jgi:hypothetical protein
MNKLIGALVLCSIAWIVGNSYGMQSGQETTLPKNPSMVKVHAGVVDKNVFGAVDPLVRFYCDKEHGGNPLQCLILAALLGRYCQATTNPASPEPDLCKILRSSFNEASEGIEYDNPLTCEKPLQPKPDSNTLAIRL